MLASETRATRSVAVSSGSPTNGRFPPEKFHPTRPDAPGSAQITVGSEVFVLIQAGR
jgi:hypothetical protein